MLPLDKYTQQTEGSIDLDPNDLPTLRRLQEAIEAQELIVDNLKYSLMHQIQDKYGIDLKESWELDLDKGELRRGTNTRQQ